MESQSTIVCFECGQRVEDPPIVHELEDGGPCRSCRDRVLASLPPILPRRRVRKAHVRAREDEARSELGEDAGH